MKALSYTLSVTWKELQVIFRDRGWLAVLFLMPLMFGGLLGGFQLIGAGGGEESAILLKVGLVNADSGNFGVEVAKAIGTITQLNITTFNTRDEAEQQVKKGELAAAIVIPADFSRQVDGYTPTAIEVIVDPAEQESAGIVTGIMNQVVAEVTIWGEVQHGIRTVLNESGLLAGASPEQQRAVEAQSLGVIMTRLNELRRNPAIAVVSEDLTGLTVEAGFNPYLAYLFPGFTVMFMFFIVGMSAESLLNERESGTFRRLLAAPIPRWAILAGKMLAYMVVASLQVIVMFTVGHLAFKVPLGQSPLALIVITIAIGLTASALGMLIAALVKTIKQAGDLSTMLTLILAAFGGAMPVSWPPIFRAEGFVGTLSNLTPQAHGAQAYFKLMAENAPFEQVVPHVGILLAMATVFFLIAARRFRFE